MLVNIILVQKQIITMQMVFARRKVIKFIEKWISNNGAVMCLRMFPFVAYESFTILRFEPTLNRQF